MGHERTFKKAIVGLLGCGNIGGGVYHLLEDFRQDLALRYGLDIQVKRILVKEIASVPHSDIPRQLLTEDPADVLMDPEIELVAEFIGGEQPAASFMQKTLEQGKTVVTANKVALASHWQALHDAAEKSGAGLYYEASVCGAVPVINVLHNSLQASRIQQVMGIINGTTNYILSNMAKEKSTYQEELARAQQLGLAEPDPYMDVEGLDAAFKLSILSTLCFFQHIPHTQVYREGITAISPEDIAFGQEMGYVLKLLGIAQLNREAGKVEVRVHPTFLPSHHPLAKVDGALNGVFLYGDACKEVMLQGHGAGDRPTAGAVVSDMIRALTQPDSGDSHRFHREDPPLKIEHNWLTRYFIRMDVTDAPGTLAVIGSVLGDAGVSIASISQRGKSRNGFVPVALVTHQVREQVMQEALKKLPPEVCAVKSAIRVEE